MHPMIVSIDDAVRDDRYDIAKKIGSLATNAARTSPTPELTERVAAAVARATMCEVEHARVARARALLKDQPADATANLSVGKFYCFAKGDWETGLPILAKSNDTVLRPLASTELNAPQSPPHRNNWLMDGGTTPRDYPRSSEIVRLHAGDWYGRAAPGANRA